MSRVLSECITCKSLLKVVCLVCNPIITLPLRPRIFLFVVWSIDERPWLSKTLLRTSGVPDEPLVHIFLDRLEPRAHSELQDHHCYSACVLIRWHITPFRVSRCPHPKPLQFVTPYEVTQIYYCNKCSIDLFKVWLVISIYMLFT